MSTTRPTTTTNTGTRSTVTTSRTVKSTAPLGNQTFLFDKSNYMWMLIGVGVLLLGFILMAGGKSENPHEFKYEEIYSARRITIAPILVLIGFAIEVYAIMKKPAVLRDEHTTTV
jgi:hypothetical protein